MIEQTNDRKAEIEDEEQERKRRASQSADMGNPAHAQLGANIRPDVGSGPAGLETRTTQKSTTYEARDAETSPDEHSRLLRDVHQLRDELHNDPRQDEAAHAAHKDASKFRDAAQFDIDASDALADQKKLEALAVDYSYAAYLSGELTALHDRFDEPASQHALACKQYGDEAEAIASMLPAPIVLNELRGQLASSATDRIAYVSLGAIAADPWNAVELPLPPNADKELLAAVQSAAEYCVAGEHDLMMRAREGNYTPPGWTGAEGEEDVHEYNEGRWLQALDRFELVTGKAAERQRLYEEQQQQGDGITPPEVAEATPRTAEERRAAFRESELAHHRERLAKYEKEQGGEQEPTQEQGGGIDWSGGIS